MPVNPVVAARYPRNTSLRASCKRMWAICEERIIQLHRTSHYFTIESLASAFGKSTSIASAAEIAGEGVRPDEKRSTVRNLCESARPAGAGAAGVHPRLMSDEPQRLDEGRSNFQKCWEAEIFWCGKLGSRDYYAVLRFGPLARGSAFRCLMEQVHITASVFCSVGMSDPSPTELFGGIPGAQSVSQIVSFHPEES